MLTQANLRSIPVEVLKNYIDYNEQTGEFTSLNPAHKIRVREQNGAPYLTLVGVPHPAPASKVAVYLKAGFWPRSRVKHADGNKYNLAYTNLVAFGLNARYVTETPSEYAVREQAIRAAKVLADEATERLAALNESGTGVSYHAASGRWRARVSLAGQQRNVGMCLTKEQATITLRDYLTGIISYTPDETSPKSPRRGVSWVGSHKMWRVKFGTTYYGMCARVEDAIAIAASVEAE